VAEQGIFTFFFSCCKVEGGHLEGELEVLEKRESIGERGIEGRMEESEGSGLHAVKK